VARTKDAIVFLHLQLEGESINRQDGRESLLCVGDFTLCDSTRRYEMVFNGANRMLVLGIPNSLLRRQVGCPESLAAIHMPGSRGTSGLLSQLLRKYWSEYQQCPRRAEQRPRRSGHSGSHRSRLCRRAAGTRRPFSLVPRIASASSITSKRISTIPDLTPTRIAEACKMTARYLHHLFSDQDETVARYILRRRLEACSKALQSGAQRGRTVTPPSRSITGQQSHPLRTRVPRQVQRHAAGISPRESRRCLTRWANGYDIDLTLFIDGERIGAAGRATHRVVNPATGGTIGELPLATPKDLDRALETAARGYRLWRARSAAERSNVLAGAARLLRERSDRIARIATMEEGKTLPEAKGEIQMGRRLVRLLRGRGAAHLRPCAGAAGRHAVARHEGAGGPRGRLLPLELPDRQSGEKNSAPRSAPAARSSSSRRKKAPGSALAVLKLPARCGVAQGSGELRLRGARSGLPALAGIPHHPQGELYRLRRRGQALDEARRRRRETHDDGIGRSRPRADFDDADLGRALDLLVSHKFRNSGQVCVSPTRFYVQEGVYGRFSTELPRAPPSCRWATAWMPPATWVRWRTPGGPTPSKATCATRCRPAPASPRAENAAAVRTTPAFSFVPRADRCTARGARDERRTLRTHRPHASIQNLR